MRIKKKRKKKTNILWFIISVFQKIKKVKIFVKTFV